MTDSPAPAAGARRFDNRITRALGIEIPIIQAPMGWIARSQLASAVSNAGGLGIIETSSGQLDEIRLEIARMRDLTDKPFGVNVAQAFIRDPGIIDFVIDQGVRFVTTSAGDPTRYTAQLKAAGLTVYHVVPTLRGAMKAVEAGVDGLVVEGGEGGGFKNPDPVASMVLLPLIRSKVDVPIVAAGGFVDGSTMVAAFALGAEAIQMGTRMVSAAESPVHDNWKKSITAAAETDTVFLNERHSPALRALKTDRTNALRFAEHNVFGDFGDAMALYFGGDMEAALALGGQVMGRIDEVLPVADIISDCAEEFFAVLDDLAGRVPGMTSTPLPPIVSPGWLQEELARPGPDLVVVDIRYYLDGRDGRAAHLAGHLPDAVFVDLETVLAAPASGPVGGRHPMPDPEVFASGLGAAGIGPHTPVVAYDDLDGMVAGRLVWMLRILGAPAALLDGGLAAWPGPVDTGPVPTTPVARPVVPWPAEAMVTADEVAAHVAAGGVVIDSRAGERYRGEVEPIDSRAGHIPGAVNLPFTANLGDDHRFRPAAELAARFAAVGADEDAIVYCGSGVSACHNLLAMEASGRGRPRLFVGSWSAWSADPARPAAHGPNPG